MNQGFLPQDRHGKMPQRRLTLSDAAQPAPWPGRPDKIQIKGEIEQQLIKLACTEPPRGRCHWTLQLLADEMVVLGLVKSISTETVRQALKKTTSDPGTQ